MLLSCCSLGFALDPALDINQCAHTAWKIRDGHFKSYINSIAQTPDGYLWLATEFGLLRFDGVRNVAWQPPPDQHLPSSYITGLLAARDGTLWIGTRKGLASWKGGKLSQYPELAGQTVSNLVEDREGTVWAGGAAISGHGKLCAIRNGGVHCQGEDGGFGRGVLGLYEDRAGNLWVGVQYGLWRWKPGRPQFYPMPDQENGIQGFGEDVDGALLISSHRGILRFADGKTDAYAVLGSITKFGAGRILRDREGGLWVGTSDRGVVHLHDGREDVFGQPEGLSGDYVLTLFEDREGNIWVTTTDGLDRFREYAVATFSVKQGLSNLVVSVLADRYGGVWLGTSDGLKRWNHGEVTAYRERRNRLLTRAAEQGVVREIVGSGLSERGVGSLFQDSRGRVWVTTFDGAGYLENDRFISIRGVPSGGVLSIAEDTQGNLWIANQTSGLFRVSPGMEVQQIPWAGLGRKDSADVLTTDPARGGLWLGFYEGGIAYFVDGHVRASYSAADGLGEGRVGGLRLDQDGTLWAATEGGLSRLKNGRIATLTSKNGLPCDAVHWMMEDDIHSIWLYTGCGLVRIARSELDDWASAVDKGENAKTILTTVFDSSDGVRSRATAGGYSPQAVKSPDGKLWFTPVDGLSVLDPSHLPFNKLPPSVHVETVKVNGKELAAADGIALSHSANDIEIGYTALSLTIPERVRFRYKLEGKDTDWQNVGTRRQAYYGGLKPKRYRFRVMACNNDGVWNEAGAAWDFSIVPAFYQTIWFQGLSVFAGAGLLWLLYRLRLRQVTARVNLLYNERLDERTRIARDLHDTLLQSLAGVSLQLDGISKRAAPETASLIGRVREQVDSAFREARGKVWNLRSTSLEVQGLKEALRQLAERAGTATDARCGVTVSGHPHPCSPEIEEELLRIAQEAINNANRHAQASELRIALNYGTGSLTLSISDNGQGFDFEEGYGKTGHWGLKNIEERAAQIRGTCKITTAAGQGTKIEVHVPLSSWSLRNAFAKHANSSSRSR
ncbi:MAG: two-component regulator propeller domain-containing protein [Bryobacteraceae bacterium]|jgi:signal transduction histidine kinase/ligand-binding sensor domain-containing protein